MVPRYTPGRLLARARKALASLFFLDQWVILTARGVNFDALRWPAFSPLIPAPDRYWADPFIVERQGRPYVFIEEKLYATGLGRIACLSLDPQGRLLSQQVVLERPYHLSYPFLLEQGGELYMLPETAQHRTVELYRCTRFPDEWQLEQTLMSGIYAVDATLLEYDGTWWLFANVKEREDLSSLDALHVFSASDFRSNSWTPHPLNPVVRDLRCARPAGRIFLQEGKLIRPAQDHSRRYGYAVRFQHITRLNPQDYAEVPEFTFEPPRQGRIQAVHTFNRSGDLVVIDAVRRRWKF